MGVIIRKYQHCGGDLRENITILSTRTGQPESEIVNYNENLSDHFIIHLNRNTEVQSHEGRGRAV